jgi:hypothetical protein
MRRSQRFREEAFSRFRIAPRCAGYLDHPFKKFGGFSDIFSPPFTLLFGT